jgi:hypothetical protein
MIIEMNTISKNKNFFPASPLVVVVVVVVAAVCPLEQGVGRKLYKKMFVYVETTI